MTGVAPQPSYHKAHSELATHFFGRGLVLATRQVIDAWLEAPDDLASMLGAHIAWGRWALEVGRYPEAVQASESGIALAEGHTSAMKIHGHSAHVSPENVRRQRAMLHGNAASAHAYDGGYDAAAKHAQAALDLLGTDVPAAFRAPLVLTLGVSHLYKGDQTIGEWAHEEAIQLGRRSGKLNHVAVAVLNLGWLALQRQDFKQAQPFLQEALDLARSLENTKLEAYCWTEWGRYHLGMNDPEKAVEAGSRAMDLLWANIASLDKAEVARVSELFGAIALRESNREMALKHLQKASFYYGQMKLWQQWMSANRQMEEAMSVSSSRPVSTLAESFEDRLSYFSSVLDMSDLLEVVSPELRLKSDFMMWHALVLAEAAGVQEATTAVLSHTARLCDVGMTSLDVDMLDGSVHGKAKTVESHLKRHVTIGAEMLGHFALPQGSLAAIRHHHERFDGLGYPDGIAGDDIPEAAQILALVDAYVTKMLVEKSTYEQTLRNLRRDRGTRFDPRLVDVLIKLHNEPAG